MKRKPHSDLTSQLFMLTDFVLTRCDKRHFTKDLILLLCFPLSPRSCLITFFSICLLLQPSGGFFLCIELHRHICQVDILVDVTEAKWKCLKPAVCLMAPVSRRSLIVCKPIRKLSYFSLDYYLNKQFPHQFMVPICSFNYYLTQPDAHVVHCGSI